MSASGCCVLSEFALLLSALCKKAIMAPVYDFRHVELDKIGRGKRIVKPPGGECSDIFGVQGGSSSPDGAQITPRKNKNNYMQSTIFSPGEEMTPPANGHSTPTTPSPAKKSEDTQNRLFGASDEDTPRKVVDRQRSKIFSDEPDSGYQTPTKSAPGPRRNPITGEPMVNGTPKSNGHLNGNGTANGHLSPESPTNGCLRNRIPPGGHSSGIF